MLVTEVVTKCVCDKCGFKWIPKNGGAELPKVCSRCKTIHWNGDVGKEEARSVIEPVILSNTEPEKHWEVDDTVC